MEFSIRAMTIEERKYAYAQSYQLASQTACIGRLHGGFGSGGTELWTTWEDCKTHWKTDEFQAALGTVISTLRSEKYGLLKDRRSMVSFARTNLGGPAQHGFRADVKEYAFLIRCNPWKGDGDFDGFCYVSQHLDRHIEKARQDIRFIDSGYQELFRLPDGETVAITMPNGEKLERVCRYIDETHLEVGNHLYHICQFAELMERNGNSYAPKEPPLPPKCFAVLPSSGDVVSIARYADGYALIRKSADFATPEGKALFVDTANRANKATKAQAAAMLAGALYGWETSAAKPKNYDENGKTIKTKNRER